MFGAQSETAAVARPAASLILLRGPPRAPRVLMGLRPADARFMPAVWVFPGGALDPPLDAVPRSGETPLRPLARAELAIAARGVAPEALARCALRETEEETGLRLAPDLGALRFVCRAITPRRLPIRFDARFFCAAAEPMALSALDAAAPADGELSALRWVGVDAIGDLAIAGITGTVLDVLRAELARQAANERGADDPPQGPARLIQTERVPQPLDRRG